MRVGWGHGQIINHLHFSFRWSAWKSKVTGQGQALKLRLQDIGWWAAHSRKMVRILGNLVAKGFWARSLRHPGLGMSR